MPEKDGRARPGLFSPIDDELSPSVLLGIQCLAVPVTAGALVIGLGLLGTCVGLTRVVETVGATGGALVALTIGALMGWFSVQLWPQVVRNGYLTWLPSLILAGGLVLLEAGASAPYYGGLGRAVSSYIARGGDEFGLLFFGVFAVCGAIGYSVAVALFRLRRAEAGS